MSRRLQEKILKIKSKFKNLLFFEINKKIILRQE